MIKKKVKNNMDKISFIITKDSFRIDNAVQNNHSDIADEFSTAPYQTFYRLVFSARPDYLDAAGSYIFRLAETFTEDLAAVSGIELSREKTELIPDSVTAS